MRKKQEEEKETWIKTGEMKEKRKKISFLTLNNETIGLCFLFSAD